MVRRPPTPAWWLARHFGVPVPVVWAASLTAQRAWDVEQERAAPEGPKRTLARNLAAESLHLNPVWGPVIYSAYRAGLVDENDFARLNPAYWSFL